MCVTPRVSAHTKAPFGPGQRALTPEPEHPRWGNCDEVLQKGDLCVRHRRVRRGLRKEQSNMIKTAINAL